MPYLLSIQLDSFQKFIEQDPGRALWSGSWHRSVFPIKATAVIPSCNTSAALAVGVDVFQECQIRGVTLTPRVKLRLSMSAKLEGTMPRSGKEQVYMGEIRSRRTYLSTVLILYFPAAP